MRTNESGVFINIYPLAYNDTNSRFPFPSSSFLSSFPLYDKALSESVVLQKHSLESRVCETCNNVIIHHFNSTSGLLVRVTQLREEI